MADEPNIPTIEQQILQAHIHRHFEFANNLRFIAAQMLLWTTDGPVDPVLGERIIYELDRMKTMVKGAFAKPAPPTEPS